MSRNVSGNGGDPIRKNERHTRQITCNKNPCNFFSKLSARRGFNPFSLWAANTLLISCVLDCFRQLGFPVVPVESDSKAFRLVLGSIVCIMFCLLVVVLILHYNEFSVSEKKTLLLLLLQFLTKLSKMSYSVFCNLYKPCASD